MSLKKKPVKIWVDENFKREIKKRAASENKSMIALTKEMAKTEIVPNFQECKPKKTKRSDYNFRF